MEEEDLQRGLLFYLHRPTQVTKNIVFHICQVEQTNEYTLP